MSTGSAEATFGRPGAAPVETAAAQFKQALLEESSAFAPGSSIWTLEHAQELLKDFNGQPDVSAASFFDKLGQQLSSTSPGAIQLFAELICLDVLPLSDYKGPTKRNLMATTLELGQLNLTLPAVIDAALDHGVMNGGVAFKTRRPFQLQYLVEMTVGLLSMPHEERARLLDDPLAFRDAVEAVTTVNAPSQKYALLYLFFPTFFLPIANGDHRARIRATFASQLGRPLGDPDQDLHDIYAALTATTGGQVDLYQAPYREQWDPKALASHSYQQSPWDRFISWAAKLDAAVDLDSEERDYKVAMAAKLEAARQEMLTGIPGWVDSLKSALNSTNLLSSYFKVDFFKTLIAHADAVRAVLTRFWATEPDPLLLTSLHDELKAFAPITPGNATSLGSVLLMARDSAQFPPYRPMPVDKARALTETPSSGTTAADRYDDLLTICDEVLERAADAGIELQDRLDAQGLIWAVVNYDPPASWTPSDKKAFLGWRGDGADTEEVTARRAWLVRGNNVLGHDVVPDWLANGFVSLAASNLREVEPGMSKDELKVVVDEDYAHAPYGERTELVDFFHQFLTRMDSGHLVLTLSQGQAYLGRINGPAVYHASDDATSNLTREVAWTNIEGILIDLLPSNVQAKIKAQREVVDLTEYLEPLEALMEVPDSPPVDETVSLPPATDDLAGDLHVPVRWLQDCLDLLADRRQLIFYGPPGTGKTYIGQALAKHAAGDNVRLVQFHPAYAYEDFFEGYRPIESGGFKLKPGPLRTMADQARRDAGTPYVLIIDEINRGNLAKIFGELYFLLEYRTEVIRLTYSDDDFTLPKNLFVIGTMNTADRSIALVDAAMRRRFAFLPLHPSDQPTKDVLRKWLIATDRPAEVADLLEALNEAIDDEDFKIGPSNFMRDSVFEAGGLDRTWRTSILPLLEEHEYGRLTRAEVEETYGLDAVRARIATPRPVDAGEDATSTAD